MSEPSIEGSSSPLIGYLYTLVSKQSGDRAALAALRRGLGVRPGTEVSMYRYVARFVPPQVHGWKHDAHYLLAALFALHPLPWSEPPGGIQSNFGASFARLAKHIESGSIEDRFGALLDAHRDDVAEHLRHLVSLLKVHEVPVDWAQLLTHLIGWDSESRWVQRQWARAFWSDAATGHTPISPVATGPNVTTT